MSDGFERLPPTILSPTVRDAVATATAAQPPGPSPGVRHYGDVIGGGSQPGWTVHLYADPPGHNVTCGADVTGVTVGARVIVGFFDDTSMSIVAVLS